MALVISPKTTRGNVEAYVNMLGLQKVPRNDCRFWHGNFRDFFFVGKDRRLSVLFTGYSGAVVGQAILQYDAQYREHDPKPGVYFVGSVYAFRDSDMEPGDLVLPVNTFSPDSFETAIYENARLCRVEDATKPDEILKNRILHIAEEEKINLKSGNVYCCISPGIYPQFHNGAELTDEGMWWNLSLSEIKPGGFNCGEYESAAALATSRLLGIPAVALLDVKDKRCSPTDYMLATSEQKENALKNMLTIVRRSVYE